MSAHSTAPRPPVTLSVVSVPSRLGPTTYAPALPPAARRAPHTVQRKIPMADSLIYITAQKRSATLWTQDEDFEGLPNVRYFPKIKAST